MAKCAYKHDFGQIITTDEGKTSVDRAFLAHINIPKALAADADGIHAAFSSSAAAVASSAVVKAASAATDILTIAFPKSLGNTPNGLKVLLTTAANNTLAVSKTEATGTINISLANTTAANNTAALVEAAIRTLTTVAGISVAAVTCTAGEDWDTAAIATGETAAVTFAGGITDVVTTGITNPAVPRNITATAGGTDGDIGAVAVTIIGTNYNDEVISEVLPAFTADTTGTKAGALAFKTVTSISMPAHDGTGATVTIGWGDIFGLPYLLYADELVFVKLFDKVVDAATVVPDAADIEKNTVDMAGTPDGTKDIDLYILV